MMKKIKKLWLLLLLAVSLIITACASSETSGNKNTSNSNNVNNSSSHLPENYPDKTMNVLVGYAPGGGTDITARKMVEALNEAGIVDQSFVVENMPGAGGAFALRELGSKRKDDPYSLVFEAVYAPSLWNGGVGNLSLEDYKPIAQIAADYVLLAVRSDSPYQTIEDLKQALEKDPQSVVISLGQPLTGDDAWMWNNIKNAIGIGGELSMVSHEGTNPAFNTVLAGDADVVAVNPGLVKDHIEKGTIKALAVTTDERVKEFKDIPTLKEAGIDTTYYRARGVIMGGGISDEVAAFWENALKEMVETETWKEYIETNDLLPIFKGSEEYTEYIKEAGNSYKEYYNSVK